MFFNLFSAQKKILVLDEPTRASHLCVTLRDQKFKSEFCPHFGKLSALIHSFQPDLFIVGITPPEKEGLDYLRKLRELHITKPVIVLSGVSGFDTRLLTRTYGATRYRTRPISSSRLTNLIDSTLAAEESSYRRRIFPSSREEAGLFPSLPTDEQVRRSLKALTEPKSIAIVGASETPGKASERRTRSLIEGGYAGDLYPINVKRNEIFGKKAYRSIHEIPTDDLDLAVLIVARDATIDGVKGACEKGAKSIIVITAGFGESDAGGKEIEDEMLHIASKTGTRIVGPNCSGIFSASSRVNLLGIPGLQRGPFSVIAQSGNVIGSLSYHALSRDTGFSRIFSAGNAIGFSFHHYLQFLNEDPDTRAIMLYIEGIREGIEFMEASRITTLNKPIIAIQVGTTEAGMRATASHTASIASSREIRDMVFRHTGIIPADNVDEMFEIGQSLVSSPLPKGKRVAIVSEGGGDNAIAAENVSRNGLRVPLLSKDTQEKIKPLLLPRMPAHNPIDYGGVAEENPARIPDVCERCLASGEIDSVLITGFYGGFSDIISGEVLEGENEAARRLIDLVKNYQRPVIVHSSFARSGSEPLEILKRGGIPVFESGSRAARALRVMDDYRENRERISRELVLAYSPPSPSALLNSRKLIEVVRRDHRNALLEVESREILQNYGMPIQPAKFVRNESELLDAVEYYHCPLAMKIVSPDIIHKSDVGGIQLNVVGKEQAIRAYGFIMDRCQQATSRERLHGILVSPMAGSGQECIIGMLRDPTFGPVLMFGLGGILVEAMKDISFRPLPLYQNDARQMVHEIQGIHLLKGYRGKEGVNIDSIAAAIEGLSLIACNHPEIVEVDLNPVLAQPDGLTILDSRMIIES